MTTRQGLVVSSGIVVTLIVSVLLAMTFKGMKEKMKPPKQAPLIRKVESAIVEYNSVKTNITGTGRVLSQFSVDVISEVQGKLLMGDISLKKGASFRKGQILAKIYNTDAVYNLKASKSSFLNAVANILPDVKIDYSDSYEKWMSFFESVNLDKDLPNLPEINSNQEKIFLAGRGILRDYYTIKANEERLRKHNLKAPFSGAVQDVYLEVGSVANPGGRIAKIIKTSDLEIEVPLQVYESKWVKIGQKAILKSENGNVIGSGIIKRESSFVDASNQSINVYVAVLPGAETLYAGQYVKVEFSGMLIAEAMEIPRNATFNNNMVFIVDTGFLAKREINILKINEKSVIFNGLKSGEELVVQPLANAHANMPVQTEFSNVHNIIPDSTKVKEEKEALPNRDK